MLDLMKKTRKCVYIGMLVHLVVDTPTLWQAGVRICSSIGKEEIWLTLVEIKKSLYY
jgi:hypothetical protein